MLISRSKTHGVPCITPIGAGESAIERVEPRERCPKREIHVVLVVRGQGVPARSRLVGIQSSGQKMAASVVTTNLMKRPLPSPAFRFPILEATIDTNQKWKLRRKKMADVINPQPSTFSRQRAHMAVFLFFMTQLRCYLLFQ